MKITDIDINEWQRLLNQFKASGADTMPNKPAAMRCENTQLSIARFSGGCTAYGERYMFFAPPIPGERNEDGTQKCAWLVVREDFMRWAAKELKRGDSK